MTLKRISEIVQLQRNFNTELYIKQKIKAINQFFTEEKLDSIVLGISGGIDSAVVLGLFNLASKELNSPLKQIMPISMPIRKSIGVTGQSIAANKAEVVIEHFNYSYYEVDLSSASNSIVRNSCDINNEKTIEEKNDVKWAIGQMNSILRTPVLYYHAAILQTNGYASIVAGTTNKDEGSYIGFYGKGSDAMNDIQIISDIHKSEVYKVAKYLKIPKEIIEATPRGDVWNNKVDEEMVGAPYWFLEMYLLMKEDTENKFYLLIEALENEEKNLFNQYSNAIEVLHQKNSHKYKVGLPSRFINIFDVAIPFGWDIPKYNFLDLSDLPF